MESDIDASFNFDPEFERLWDYDIDNLDNEFQHELKGLWEIDIGRVEERVERLLESTTQASTVFNLPELPHKNGAVVNDLDGRPAHWRYETTPSRGKDLPEPPLELDIESYIKFDGELENESEDLAIIGLTHVEEQLPFVEDNDIAIDLRSHPPVETNQVWSDIDTLEWEQSIGYDTLQDRDDSFQDVDTNLDMLDEIPYLTLGTPRPGPNNQASPDLDTDSSETNEGGATNSAPSECVREERNYASFQILAQRLSKAQHMRDQSLDERVKVHKDLSPGLGPQADRVIPTESGKPDAVLGTYFSIESPTISTLDDVTLTRIHPELSSLGTSKVAQDLNSDIPTLNKFATRSHFLPVFPAISDLSESLIPFPPHPEFEEHKSEYSIDDWVNIKCSSWSLTRILKEFSEGLGEGPTELRLRLALNSLSWNDSTVLGDIQCAIDNDLDIGKLAAIASIRWANQICRMCKGREAVGNTVWKLPCISRRCEEITTWKCSCLQGNKISGNVKLEEGLYHPSMIDGTIKEATLVPPRRLWDVKFNRVLLFYGEVIQLCLWCLDNIENPPRFEQEFLAISHSWVDNMSSSVVETPANSLLWPVPFPQSKQSALESKDAHFMAFVHAVREKGYRYAWVDVLCLRQFKFGSSDLENRRLEEWQVDVPTIGNIYRLAAKVMRYMNGLGRNMKTDLKSWRNPRHWINRAWTLQEIRPEYMIINPKTLSAGLWPEFWNIQIHDSKAKTSKPLRKLLKPVHDLAQAARSEEGCSILMLVKEMSKRSSTNSVDKIAGINYLMWPSGRTFDLPVYDAKMDIDTAWLHCVEVMRYELKLELLFLFPTGRDKEAVMKQPTEVKNQANSLQDDDNKFSNTTTLMEAKIELARRHPSWIPTWAQAASLKEDVWERLPLRVLSPKVLPDPGHPLVVPTFLAGSSRAVGMLCFDDCQLSGTHNIEPGFVYGSEPFLELRVSTGPRSIHSLRTTFYTSEMSQDYLLDFWQGHRAGPQPLTFVLSLGLEHDLPLLVCRGAQGVCQNLASSIQDISQFVLQGFTKYPRTLMLEKVAVIHHSSDVRRFMEGFPMNMPWPQREYDAIFIV